MSNRRNFKERFDKEEEVSLREFMYPLMQGYDSVVVNADVEIGGFDQLFNLKAGRVIQKYYNKPEQDIMVTSMLEGTDGRKMSTSWGNVINISDEPNDMFGKVMSLKDELISKYFLLCTNISIEEISKIESDIRCGINPRDAKVRLAKEIVSLYHNKFLADKAEENFVNTFKKGGVPDDVDSIEAEKGSGLLSLASEKKIVSSNSEFRRLISENAVSIVETGEKITDPNYKVEQSAVFKIGKRRFLKVIVK
jgi:tyrosyl-tRNA synthetase